MAKVVLIGAGQLGSRHLQAITQSKSAKEVFVVDPLEESLAVAKSRALEVIPKSSELLISYSTSLDLIPEYIDFAVIASNSKVRFSIMQNLFEKSTVNNLVLEKILFQNIDEYQKAEELLKKHGVNTWVNCPRRMFPFYKELRNSLSQNEHIHFSYTGSDWGLACNSIHFIDLATFISGNHEWDIITDSISEVIDSKRAGYKEVLGTLCATGKDGSTITLTCDKQSLASGVLTISGESFTCFVDEVRGSAMLFQNNEWKPKEFKVKYQSGLTDIVLDSIMETGTCSLTPFRESATIHSSFIAAVAAVFQDAGISGCPIT